MNGIAVEQLVGKKWCCEFKIYGDPQCGNDGAVIIGLVGAVASMPGFCFFHFVRRFWNQILTCVSVKLNDIARFKRSHTERYRVVLNLFSKATSCSYVNAVLARRGLPSLPFLSVERFRFFPKVEVFSSAESESSLSFSTSSGLSSSWLLRFSVPLKKWT